MRGTYEGRLRVLGQPPCHGPGCDQAIESEIGPIFVIRNQRIIGYCSVGCFLADAEATIARRGGIQHPYEPNPLAKLGYSP